MLAHNTRSDNTDRNCRFRFFVFPQNCTRLHSHTLRFFPSRLKWIVFHRIYINTRFMRIYRKEIVPYNITKITEPCVLLQWGSGIDANSLPNQRENYLQQQRKIESILLNDVDRQGPELQRTRRVFRIIKDKEFLHLNRNTNSKYAAQATFGWYQSILFWSLCAIAATSAAPFPLPSSA